MFDLDFNIRSWSDYLRAHGSFSDNDILEMESHLHDEIDELTQNGLTEEEAFLIGVKRLGNVNQISREFEKVNAEGFWKQLLSDAGDPAENRKKRSNILLVIALSLFAGTLLKVPELFGMRLFESDSIMFQFKNLSLFLFPFVAIFFMVNHASNRKWKIAILSAFVITAFIINLYPSLGPGDTELLTAFHLPILLWMVTGLAYLGKEWKSSRKRMDFIRFSGETFIYGVLIFCGLMVFILFTQLLFSAIQVNLSGFIQEYLIIYGFSAVLMVAVYLVEAKKSVVENFTPILAKIFSPLFLLTMVAFLIGMAVLGKSPFLERDFLIGFDFMLVLVLALVLYVLSARGIHDKVSTFDYLNFALIVAAIIIDLIALAAIIFRLTAYGITPNKLAALGENLILMINLGGLAWMYTFYFRKKIEFSQLEDWQTKYLAVYLVWMAVVVFLFPILFGFR
ncbi:MAG: permease prefix domain 1-containing protein [Erysipelotrichaceae bacterium]